MEINGDSELCNSDEESDMMTYGEDWEEWERKRCESIVQVVAYTSNLTSLTLYHQFRDLRRMTQNNTSSDYMMREKRRLELMNDNLKVVTNYRGLTRMSPHAFESFCKILRDGGYLSGTRRASVEEQVAKFLYIVRHNARNFTLPFFSQRLGETSCHFHRVLNVIISMEANFLKQRNGVDTPLEIQNDNRFSPYFKDCVGVIDGTHIRVKVAEAAHVLRFRGRKRFPSTNVLIACTFELKFTYVLAGWEGTASDSRVVKNALYSREDKLNIPTSKYYLGDACYMSKHCLITPYRSVRYHLKEYSSRGPTNKYELFNHRHISLRNAIERTFGMLQK